MKSYRHSTILTITAVISAAILFTAITKNLNAGQRGYDQRYYGYDPRYQPPPPQGYQHYAPGMPYRMPANAYPAPQDSLPGNPDSAASVSTTNNVLISGMRFQPAAIRVKSGEKVTWINNASMPHTVTGRNDGKLASEQLGRGSLFNYTFKNPGTYEYYCSLHPSMKGLVIVE